MPKVSLMEEIKLLKQRNIELEQIKKHQECQIKKLLGKWDIKNSHYFKDIVNFDTIEKFNDETPNLWFVTMSYDPKYICIYSEEEEHDFYETITFKSIDTSEHKFHGCYEYTKQGKLHVHMLLQIYDINTFVSNIKPLLTHRRNLNYCLDVVQPSKNKSYNEKSGVEGCYEYMSKSNGKKFAR